MEDYSELNAVAQGILKLFGNFGEDRGLRESRDMLRMAGTVNAYRKYWAGRRGEGPDEGVDEANKHGAKGNYGHPALYGSVGGIDRGTAEKDVSRLQMPHKWAQATSTKAEVEAARARARNGNKGVDKPPEYPPENLPKGVKPPNVKALKRAFKRGFTE